jgi:four helix bundle protein
MGSYTELVVWQKSIDMVAEVYRLTKQLPRDELYVLVVQMRRAAVSVPSNIAEGQSRVSAKEFGRFLAIARGSKAELETQLRICVKIGYFSTETIEPLLGQLEEIGRMLAALGKKVTN